jgi:hypothetical protein
MIDLDERAADLDLTLSPESREAVQKNLTLLAAMATVVEKAAPAEGPEGFVL